MSWNKYEKEYKRYLSLEKNLAENSVNAYMRDLTMLRQFIEKEYAISPAKVTAQHIEAFLSRIYDLGINKTSQARILSGIKSFFNYLLINEFISKTPTEFTEAPKIHRKLPAVLSIDEIRQMMDAIDLSTTYGHRNRAILEMLYSSGLRVTELITLQIEDLFFDDGFIRVVGKGDKMRLVPVNEVTIKMVNLYLSERKLLKKERTSSGFVFLNNRGKGLSRVMIFNIIKQIATAAGINKPISPHTFRHSFASHLVQNGADIRVVQQMLGHESITTTEIYTHLNRDDLRQAVEKFHPLSR